MDSRPHELILVCRGAQVTASLDGKAIPLYENTSARSGCIQFNPTVGTLRVFSVEYRTAP